MAGMMKGFFNVHAERVVFRGWLILASLACERRLEPRVVVAYTSVDQVFSEPIFRHC